MKSILPAALALIVTAPALPFVQGSPDGWTALDVPSAWEKAGGEKLAKYDGFAWYRCAVKVPDNWKGEDLSLAVAAVRNVHEVFFNGQRVGSCGSFPPDYRDGFTPQAYNYTVPAKHVRAGAANTITVRVYNKNGPGGFTGAAPYLANEGRAIALKGTWQFRVGDDPAWADAADLPAEVTYAKVEDAAAVLKRVGGGAGPGPLPPAEALKSFKVADGLVLEQVLTEPVVKQPVSLTFDERGRMWVVQYLQYPHPAGLKLLSRDNYWRAVFDKVPPPPPNHFKGKDKITVHEDTDGDGVFDKHHVFVEGLNITTAVAHGRGGVWVLNPPYLLFYKTTPDGLKPVGDPEVHLEGFGLEDTHSVVNSLCWGPDGWLYAAQGSTVTGNVRRPGSKEVVHSQGQLIWRYHPEKRKYEIFAEGGGNAFGVEIDSKGRVFSGHNGGNTRGFHYVQGGYSQKGFSKHGPLTNPYAFGYFQPMKHADVPRFTHTFAIYEGGAFPERYRGKLFAAAPLQGQIVMSELLPDGSTFKTRDLGHAVTTSDTWFRPVDIKHGPDGALYIADWYDSIVNHFRNHEGQYDPDHGRIYRLRAKDGPAPKVVDLSRLSTKELIGKLSDSNRQVRQATLRVLSDRGDRAAAPLARDMLRSEDAQKALQGLWALSTLGGFDHAAFLSALGHPDPHVRAWAVRLLGDGGDLPTSLDIAEWVTVLKRVARAERHPEVRSQLACTARRLPAGPGLAVVSELLQHDEDVKDPHLPLLLWWAVEARAESARNQVLDLFADSQVWARPLVQQHLVERLMRRYAQAGGRENLLTCAKLLDLAPDDGSAKRLLSGFELAFAGRPVPRLPEELVKALAKRGGGSLALRLRLGDARAVDEALTLIRDARAKREERQRVLQLLGEVKQPRVVPALLNVVTGDGNDELRQVALAALQAYDDPAIADAVVKLYPSLKGDVLAAAQSLLVSRTTWARRLLDAVDAGAIAKASLPLDTVRRLTLHNDEGVARLVARHWGKVQGATTEQMRKTVERLEGVVRSGTGSPFRGKRLFEASCAKCHTLFGRGEHVGPDLSTYKRDDLSNMLLHIVNPSAEIREGYESHLVTTHDGRALTGFVVERDNRAVVLRGADGIDVTLERDNIDVLRVVPQSLMPEGLLDTMSDGEVRDLFAYLRSTQPLND